MTATRGSACAILEVDTAEEMVEKKLSFDATSTQKEKEKEKTDEEDEEDEEKDKDKGRTYYTDEIVCGFSFRSEKLSPKSSP